MYGTPNFKIAVPDICNEDEGEDCEATQPLAVARFKYDLRVNALTDRKYKCRVLGDLLDEEDFEDVYVNQAQGILHVFVYAESEKRAKFKLWKIMKRNDMVDYFHRIEVRDSAEQ